MKIACPNCSTKYSLKEQALGDSGRKMKCAKCEHVWLALPPQEAEPNVPAQETFTAAQVSDEDTVPDNWDEKQWDQDLAWEDAEDAKKVSAAQNASSEAASHYETADEAKEKRHLRHILNRAVAATKSATDSILRALLWLKGLNWKEQVAVVSGLLMPLVLVGGIYVSRDRLVSQFPDLASLYDAVGIHVNLQGLTFEDVRTVRRPENGVAVLVVEGAIRNITNETMQIPQLHFILSGRNREVYSWQDNTASDQLPSGERIEFRTVLASPPDVADQLHVRFFNKNSRLNNL
ncbi:MAG: zinc-ribbon domain-containing protein [Hyphomicrobiales bacterium]|uniref:zinc-ribbon domain-containing protein n=1 Tax=Nisaea sp. TaxID=2024842 RepID=UPI00327B67F1